VERSAADQDGPDKLLLRAIRGNAIERVPFWLMRQAGRYLPEYRAVRAQAGSFLQLCYDPDLAAEVTLQPIRRFGMDAAILFSDILVVPHGLGQQVGFKDGEGPVLEPIRDARDLQRLDPARQADILAPVYETVRRVAAALPAETAFVGFAGAPWTVATYVVEGGSSRTFDHARKWAQTDPIGFGRLIDILILATIEHLSAQISAGVEVVQLFDSWASALEGAAFDRWVIEPTRRIVGALRERHPGVPVIGFPRASGTGYDRFLAETGVDVIGIGQDMPLDWARDVLQPRAAIQGNLDPAVLVAGGAELAADIDRIIGTLGAGRLIFNLGHGIVPQTPVEHVAELARHLRARSLKNVPQ
jgi:uroporphyrinogen decarboxylase